MERKCPYAGSQKTPSLPSYKSLKCTFCDTLLYNPCVVKPCGCRYCEFCINQIDSCLNCFSLISESGRDFFSEKAVAAYLESKVKENIQLLLRTKEHTLFRVPILDITRAQVLFTLAKSSMDQVLGLKLVSNFPPTISSPIKNPVASFHRLFQAFNLCIKALKALSINEICYKIIGKSPTPYKLSHKSSDNILSSLTSFHFQLIMETFELVLSIASKLDDCLAICEYEKSVSKEHLFLIHQALQKNSDIFHLRGLLPHLVLQLEKFIPISSLCPITTTPLFNRLIGQPFQVSTIASLVLSLSVFSLILPLQLWVSKKPFGISFELLASHVLFLSRLLSKLSNHTLSHIEASNEYHRSQILNSWKIALESFSLNLVSFLVSYESKSKDPKLALSIDISFLYSLSKYSLCIPQSLAKKNLFPTLLKQYQLLKDTDIVIDPMVSQLCENIE